MLRPDVAEQLNAIESVGARRARLVCSVHLTEVAGALLSQLKSAQADAPPTDNSLHSFSLHLRARESTRKAAALFLRIARHHPSTKPTAPSSALRAPSSELSLIPHSQLPIPSFPPPTSAMPHPKSDISSIPHSEFPTPNSPSALISSLRAADPTLFQNLSDEKAQALIIEAVAHITTPLTAEQIASLPDETIFSLILNHLRSTHSPGP